MYAEPERLLPGRTAKVNLAADLALIGLAIASATTWHAPAPRPGVVLALIAAAALLWTLPALIVRHYDARTLRPRLEDLAVVTLLALGPVLALAVASVLAPGAGSLPPLEPLLPLVWVPLAAVRLGVFRPLYETEENCGDVLIVGTGFLAQATARALRARRGCRIKGYVQVGDEAGELAGPVLGGFEELQHLLLSDPVDEVVFAVDPTRERHVIERGTRICEDLGLPFDLPIPSLRLGRARVIGEQAATEGYVHFRSDEPKPYQQAAKRIIDVLGASLAILVLSPVLILAALAVKLTSRGPLLFRQQRVGLRGRHFTMYKFRSMVMDAERRRSDVERLNEQKGPVFKIRHDPRITPVGRFIRRFSIDELPQLFNVLAGHMSLVGPRPPIQSEVNLYEPWQRRRLSVRPGITCIWQVSGRNEIPFERWMVLDMRYIDTWSLGLDLRLMLKTIPAVLGAKGAS